MSICCLQSRLSALFAALVVLLGCARAQVTEFIDYEFGLWEHVYGQSAGWDQNESEGTYTLADGTTMTMTVSYAGTATPTANNLSIIDTASFRGFGFQMVPTSSSNTATFENYQRIDFEFSRLVDVADLIISDIDRNSGDDVVYIEYWSGGTGVGAMGTGTTVSYEFGTASNLGVESVYGLDQVVVRSGGNTNDAPESSLIVNVPDLADAFTIYYWNGDRGNSASQQTVGLTDSSGGGGFSVTLIPEPSVLLLLPLFGLCRVFGRRRPQPYGSTGRSGLPSSPSGN